jgi:hypothetical protein
MKPNVTKPKELKTKAKERKLFGRKAKHLNDSSSKTFSLLWRVFKTFGHIPLSDKMVLDVLVLDILVKQLIHCNIGFK